MKKLITSVLIAINCFGVEFVVEGQTTMSDKDYKQAIEKYVNRHYPKKVKEYDEYLLRIGIWKDFNTGLIWQYKINKNKYDWQDAKKYCQNLSLYKYNDWRLPNIDELESILTDKAYENSISNSGKSYIKKPLLNSMITKSQLFWSSTSSSFNSFYAIDVNFGSNYIRTNGKEKSRYVRCIR